MNAKTEKSGNQIKKKAGTGRAVVALLLLAPICGEMLSGSESPVNWLNPGLWILMSMYGIGALLIRECVHRWGKGFPGILLLGMAYGIYEEGLVARSFFSPDWPDLDVLARYGRELGVNWVWTINLTWFHAVISILIPILIVERLLFPEVKNVPWLTKRGIVIHCLLLFAWIPLGMFVLGMPASPIYLLASVAVIGLLVLLARVWKQPDAVFEPDQKNPKPGVVWIFGFVGMLCLIVTMWIIPNTNTPDWIGIAASFFLLPIMILIAHRLKVHSWKPRQQWAYVAGSLGVWIVLALFVNESRDMVVAGVGFVVFLWILKRRVWKNTCLSSKSNDKDSIAGSQTDIQKPEEE